MQEDASEVPLCDGLRYRLTARCLVMASFGSFDSFVARLAGPIMGTQVNYSRSSSCNEQSSQPIKYVRAVLQ